MQPGRRVTYSLLFATLMVAVPLISSCEVDPAAARNRTATAQASEIADLKATIEAQRQVIAVLLQTPTPAPSPTPDSLVQETAAAATLEAATATETPSPTPQSALRWKVANTGGAGVYIRRTATMGDRIKAWPDNTIMERAGDDVVQGGRTWRHVKDPDGNVGYIPSDYLVPAQ